MTVQIDLRMETLIHGGQALEVCPGNGNHDAVMTNTTPTEYGEKRIAHVCMICQSEWDVIDGVQVEYINIVPSKPEWTAAPSWARYLCQNKNGTWMWFSDYPFPINKVGRWETSSGPRVSAHIVDDHMCTIANWRQTLEHRSN